MTKLRVKIGGVGDPPTPLTPKQRQDWNAYVDFVEKKGYKGSPLLDKKDTGLATSLLDEFIKTNPGTSINHDSVKSVQTEMQGLAKSAQDFAKRHGDSNAEKVMAGTSQVDGWPGSKTTSFRFPSMTLTQAVNNVPVSSKNLGILDSSLNPTTNTGIKPLPPNAKLEEMQDGWYYEDVKGNIIKYKSK